MRRPFMILLIGAAIWGVSLGMAFIGGIAVGKVQTGEAPPVSPHRWRLLLGQQASARRCASASSPAK